MPPRSSGWRWLPTIQCYRHFLFLFQPHIGTFKTSLLLPPASSSHIISSFLVIITVNYHHWEADRKRRDSEREREREECYSTFRPLHVACQSRACFGQELGLGAWRTGFQRPLCWLWLCVQGGGGGGRQDTAARGGALGEGEGEEEEETHTDRNGPQRRRCVSCRRAMMRRGPLSEAANDDFTHGLTEWGRPERPF